MRKLNIGYIMCVNVFVCVVVRVIQLNLKSDAVGVHRSHTRMIRLKRVLFYMFKCLCMIGCMCEWNLN